MGFYNVANGDAPYLTKLARKYTLNDNYHQPVMGGTFANQMMFGYADALYYSDANGDPATPDLPRPVMSRSKIPIRWPGTNNWYSNDGYGTATGGGSYTNCSDYQQPGVASIVNYLNAIHVPPNCAPRTYYLLNNYVPALSAAERPIRSTTGRSPCRPSSSSRTSATGSARPGCRGPISASAGTTSRPHPASAPTSARSTRPPISTATSATRSCTPPPS